VSDGNLEIVRRGFEAFSRGDLDAVAAFLDPEVRWHGGDPSAEGACVNRDQALRFMRRRRDPAVNPLPEIVELIEAGDRVVIVLRTPAEAGSAPRLHANVTTLRDGRAVEMVHYDDPAAALEAVGVKRPRAAQGRTPPDSS
jgi:ketosteroid isomerase-like protein